MDQETANALLGVDAATPIDEVRSRYRIRARMLHPDTLAGRPGLLDEANRAMATLNEAWQVISEADEAGTRKTGETSKTTTELRPPIDGECELCGAYPSRLLRLRGTRGLILARREIKIESQMCRPCGRSMFREVQADTLARGWWGIGSALLTIPYLLLNLLSMLSHRRTPAPLGRATNVITPFPPDLPAAPPVLRRPGPVIATLFVMTLLVAAFAAGQTPQVTEDTSDPQEAVSPEPSGVTPSGGTSESAPTLPSPVGLCITATAEVRKCDDPYVTHQIVAQVSDRWECGELVVLNSPAGETFCARPLWGP